MEKFWRMDVTDFLMNLNETLAANMRCKSGGKSLNHGSLANQRSREHFVSYILTNDGVSEGAAKSREGQKAELISRHACGRPLSQDMQSKRNCRFDQMEKPYLYLRLLAALESLLSWEVQGRRTSHRGSSGASATYRLFPIDQQQFYHFASSDIAPPVSLCFSSYLPSSAELYSCNLAECRRPSLDRLSKVDDCCDHCWLHFRHLISPLIVNGRTHFNNSFVRFVERAVVYTLGQYLFSSVSETLVNDSCILAVNKRW